MSEQNPIYRIVFPDGGKVDVTKEQVEIPRFIKAIEYIESEFACIGVTLDSGTTINLISNEGEQYA